MAKIIVYNNDTDRIETYYRDLTDSMPYNTNRTLTVKEFRGSSNSNTLWTTKRTMTSWNTQRYMFGSPIPVGYAFKRSWVHFDRRQYPPACTSGGYPTLKRGSLSVYVLIAQDDLNTLGYSTGGLDGIFGSRTHTAVRNYQSSRGLIVDGIIGCNTWRSLQENVLGTGRTSTTID